jgi:hypothetical protein
MLKREQNKEEEGMEGRKETRRLFGFSLNFILESYPEDS